MIFTYSKCLEQFKNDYNIGKMLEDGNLYRVEKGLYSTEKICSETEIVSVKYSYAIFTMDSAFYYHSLTDVVPDKYFLATRRNATRIHDKRIKQSFQEEDIFELGKTEMKYNNFLLCIYNQERMLIELVRNKNRIPYDYYKEIVGHYRERVNKMDFTLVEEYTAHFAGADRYMEIIEAEVL